MSLEKVHDVIQELPPCERPLTMTTSVDLNAHQQKLSLLHNYAGQKNLLNNLEWCPSKIGHTVYNKTEEEPFIGIVVGKVVEHKLKVGPSSNFINDDYRSLAKAKFQLFLTPPITPALRSDFE
ncbi:hypothetical protein J3R82DRAFT_9687 [Butyriboletus roseoflavus]|nr:hypothetical protein J3R82DRAFT_9687 [Butyriboletus roseoflavus]